MVAGFSEASGAQLELEQRIAEGRNAIENGEFERAEALFRQLGLEFPRSAAVRLGQATAMVGLGQTKTAHRGLLRAGESAIERGDYVSALELLEMARDLAASDATTLALAGRAAVLAERHQAAVVWLEAAVEQGASDWRTWVYLGAARWEVGALAGAEEASQRAVERSGGHPIAVHQLGRLFLWSGKYVAAETLLASVDSSDAPVDFVMDLARSQEGQKNFDAARATFERAVAAAPDSYRSRWGLAQVLLRLGAREAAQEQLVVYRSLYEADQRMTRETGLEQAAREAAERWLELGDAERALDALPAKPWSVETTTVAAAIYQRTGDTATATALLETAVEEFPERADLRVRLQELRLRRGELELEQR